MRYYGLYDKNDCCICIGGPSELSAVLGKTKNAVWHYIRKARKQDNKYSFHNGKSIYIFEE